VTPYADLTYFLLLLYPLLVLVVLGGLGHLGRRAVLLLSLAVVAFQYDLRPLILVAGCVAASTGIVLGYSSAVRRGAAGQLLFYAAVGLVLLPLVAVKVYPLAAGDPVSRASTPGLFDTFAFLGLSYMSLRAVDAVIAVHDGVVSRAPRAADVVGYLVFVPTISAGPIDRFHRFTRDLDALPHRPRDYLLDVQAGIHRVARGFLYKFIVADLIDRYALRPLGDRAGFLAGIEYMYAFSLYLFFDFAGYSAFAVGVARFFGMHVPENFNAPFASRNFRELWDRWHISLSWWLRDHVYMRFMLNAARRRWFGGNRQWAHAIALLLTMGLMGCWHGLERRYVVYGLYQGLMLVAYDAATLWNKRHRLIGDGRLANAAAVFTTFNLFCFGLLIFSGRLFR
jgi:membrane protein involved in D-alanine export